MCCVTTLGAAMQAVRSLNAMALNLGQAVNLRDVADETRTIFGTGKATLCQALGIQNYSNSYELIGLIRNTCADWRHTCLFLCWQLPRARDAG